MRDSEDRLAGEPLGLTQASSALAETDRPAKRQLPAQILLGKPRRAFVRLFALALAVSGIGALAEAFAPGWDTLVWARWRPGEDRVEPTRGALPPRGDRTSASVQSPIVVSTEPVRRIQPAPAELQTARLKLADGLVEKAARSANLVPAVEGGTATGSVAAPAQISAGLAPAARLDDAGAQPERAQPKPGETVGARVLQSPEPREADNLLKRGADYFAAGNLAAARPLLQRLAEDQNAQAALILGATYDPLVLKSMQVYAFATHAADIGKARVWYQRAREYGMAEAQQRLELLAQLAQ